MRKETFTQQFLRRLDAHAGMHSRIAKETGIGQATISRIFLRKASPRLDTVEPIQAWLDRQEKGLKRRKSASRAAVDADAAGRGAATGTAAPLGE